MLSSLNAYSGISAADILKLFAANSSSSSASASSDSTSADTAQSASAGVSVSSANDPGNAIKAILALAETDKSGGGTASSVAVAAAYAVQMATFDGGSSTNVAAESAVAVQTGVFTPSFSMADQMTGQSEGVNWSVSYSMTNVPPASTSDSTNTPQTGQTDYFELDLTMGNTSIAVAFSVDGLGLPTNTDGEFTFASGDQDTNLQIGACADGGANVSFDLNINGINTAQAQKVQAAFNEAASSPIVTGNEPGTSLSIQASNTFTSVLA